MVSVALAACKQDRGHAGPATPASATAPPATSTPVSTTGPAVSPPARVAATPDPSVLVVVHSWSGRTARVAGTLGRMLGASVIEFHDPPMADAPAEPPLLTEVLPRVSLAGVKTLFLGFPVWGAAPSPHVGRLVSAIRLDGIRVVPFYTYIHALSEQSLSALGDAIRARGGEVQPAMPFLVPLTVTMEDVDGRAARALLARRELWAEGMREEPQAACASKNPRDGAELCRVPAGVAWLGDAAEGAPPGAPQPARVRVGAFDVDRREVTVGDYRRCVAAGACQAIDFTQSFCGTLLGETKDPSALPLPCATYTHAAAYCGWAGMRLPTEAEWIRAGRGETMAAYPWGDTFSSADGPLRGNFGEKPGVGFPGYSTVPDGAPWRSDGVRGLTVGCSFPAGSSPFGVCDLSGSLAEWVRTEGAGGDVAKGGSWLDGEPAALRLGMSSAIPSVFSRKIGIYVTGIRCARDAR